MSFAEQLSRLQAFLDADELHEEALLALMKAHAARPDPRPIAAPSGTNSTARS